MYLVTNSMGTTALIIIPHSNQLYFNMQVIVRLQDIQSWYYIRYHSNIMVTPYYLHNANVNVMSNTSPCEKIFMHT